MLAPQISCCPLSAGGHFQVSEMAVSDSVSSFVILEDEKEEGSVRELLRDHVEKRARLHV